ncbi:uncharacterized protein LOC116203830 isoform X4 [Punica granatum]|uniref:Uncharacterized protein LOC116203830 isoform X4 n=1 Tax=Punica granatum TaxID=22663 RepID=A0A6P8DJA9_PUNGR|nr:uncharacterized protein LOC116203830 isoform X4 [Punica granatum]
MEESSLSPECPVCLQVYDGSDTVPRVLPCGHSACQSCLGQLPERFPQTIRCPACTQLVKFPSSRGPSSLPKNIDLLRLCGDPSGRGNGDGDEKLLNSENDRPHQQFFLPDSWSNEFYTKWRELILPQDAISVQEGGTVVGKTIGSGDFAAMFFNLLQSGVYVSPDVLLALLKKKQVTTEDSLGIIDSASYGSDVWAVGCMLIKLLVGKEFTVESWRLGGEEDMDFSVIYEKWLGDVSSLLETKLFDEYQTLCQMLLGCLNLDRRCRPVLADVWKSVRELLTKHWFDNLKRVEVTDEKSFMYCLILGKLCQMSDEVKETSTENDLHEINAGLENHNGKEDPEKDLGESLSQENVKCKELRSHLDCVTGLAVGGDLLFSSSFDKTLQLWSLQDFSHVHTFRGHEHKIMAVVYVDDEQPLCVTADGGGGIFVWDIGSFPLGNEPLKKWYEEKDWRYSGIHSLAYSRSGYLYTGGGDKLIKAWTLQDCTLSCSMEGHKSVVSSLVVSQGALYSGSWDGMIRLWCLSDHSPLTVLGEEIPGKVSSVLSLKAEKDMLVAVHENGTIKIWKNEMLMKSVQSHRGAIFSVSLDGKWLFTGGWDKTVSIQELSDEERCCIDLRSVGSISCGSVITALLSSQGKLFVASADRTVKVYYPGKQ